MPEDTAPQRKPRPHAQVRYLFCSRFNRGYQSLPGPCQVGSYGLAAQTAASCSGLCNAGYFCNAGSSSPTQVCFVSARGCVCLFVLVRVIVIDVAHRTCALLVIGARLVPAPRRVQGPAQVILLFFICSVLLVVVLCAFPLFAPLFCLSHSYP